MTVYLHRLFHHKSFWCELQQAVWKPKKDIVKTNTRFKKMEIQIFTRVTLKKKSKTTNLPQKGTARSSSFSNGLAKFSSGFGAGGTVMNYWLGACSVIYQLNVSI